MKFPAANNFEVSLTIKKQKIKQITFVCVGNTCRSPMAEMALKDCLKKAGLKDYAVKSCGISCFKKENMNPLSKSALKQCGIRSQRFVSKPFSMTVIGGSFLVLCMTQDVKNHLPDLPHVKTFAQQVRGQDVPDPFGGTLDDYVYTCKKLIEMCEKLTLQLKFADSL